MRRDWSDALAKVEAQGGCRVCAMDLRITMSPEATRVEAAHVIGRARDVGGWVNPNSIVPLCGPATTTSTCHGKYDAHRLDLMPYLTPDEQTQAVTDAGGIELARRRISGRPHLKVVRDQEMRTAAGGWPPPDPGFSGRIA